MKKLKKDEKPRFINNHSYKILNQRPVLATQNLYQNVKFIEDALWNTEDLQKKELMFSQKRCVILYFPELIDKKGLKTNIIQPILEKKSGNIEEIITVEAIEKSNNLNEVKMGIIRGYCAFFMENNENVYLFHIPSSITRDIQEPTNEQVIRGSHEGFVEDIQKNLHLLRKRIENPNLVVRYISLGEASDTKVAILSIKNLTNPKLVEEVEKRVTSISVDSVQTLGYIEEFIEDNPFSLFPQILSTERPDRAASMLMEGRVALFMEGSASALIMPVTFFTFFQSPDDYNSRFYVGTLYRLFRLISFILAVTLPALYIATVSFHFEVIPTELLFTVKSSLEFVPFPPMLEALIMVVILELLKEASVRLPAPIAQTIGVVGGLVIGTAIVEASLVSKMMIIIVALTAIASFSVPSNEMSIALRIISFPMMLGATLFGYLGIEMILMFLLMHLCKLENFGTPYFAPFAPLRMKDLKDTIVRMPAWKMNNRPLDPHPQAMKQQHISREWKRNGKK
ncbi:spore germination protein [Aeribacillus alveayuensis]|uniref:Spore germination protein KA n=1 Tax=Aeribacillus alveayuensis TaxID=279215 RepID=A0ABT9VMR0_9BACI|nr:spore germination protein KA [Bacillus alveayuensis]